MKKKNGRKIITVILVIIVCIFALFPFVWMISTSFKPAQEVYSSTPSFVPKNPTANGYEEMLTTKSTTFDFMQWTVNSVSVSLLTTLFSMVIATLGGYGISRFRFRGRNALSYIILTTQVLPGSLLIIPLYIIMGNMQLLDTRMGLVMAYATFSVPFCTWMMKGFFDSIPVSLEEAAKVDGANAVQRFFKITLPYMLYVTTPYLIVTFTGNVNNFNIIYLLSGGDPVTDLASTAGKTDLLVTWLYKLTIDKQYYNIGAVIGILTFIILAVGALLTYRNSKSYKEGGI